MFPHSDVLQSLKTCLRYVPHYTNPMRCPCSLKLSGENPSTFLDFSYLEPLNKRQLIGRVYDGTRMDTFWAFRKASVQDFNRLSSRLLTFQLSYDTARQLKEKQDAFCHKAHKGEWDSLESQSFPEDLQWEALVDVLRGRVKVQTHCYEAVDLDDLVRVCSSIHVAFFTVVEQVCSAQQRVRVPNRGRTSCP